MKYYKLIGNGEFIGVATSDDFRKYQSKHRIILICNEDSAQYVQVNEKLYRDNWLSPVSTESIGYEEANVIAIDKDEYDALYEAMETGEEIKLVDEEHDVQEEMPQIAPEEEVTIEYLKNSKINEMSIACNKAITNGFDVVLSDGETYHFSLTIQDQLNLIMLSAMVSAGETVIPYHADGELCRYYSCQDISTISAAATAHKTYHITYFNSLKSWIDSLDNIQDIASVRYGDQIPAEYQSDILKELLLKTVEV